MKNYIKLGIIKIWLKDKDFTKQSEHKQIKRIRELVRQEK